MTTTPRRQDIGQAANQGRRLRQPSGGTSISACVNVLTQHNDNGRTGANLAETQLTVESVGRQGGFGALYNLPTDGEMYAQVLIACGVVLPGRAGPIDVAVAATMNNSVYAYDANNAQLLWRINVGAPVPVDLWGDYHDIKKAVGILSTPVIRRDDWSLYFVAMVRSQQDGRQYTYHRLHRVDLRTGLPLADPVVIAATFPGRATGSDIITFDSKKQLQRPGLLLSNNTIYLGFGSAGDIEPYQGWVLAYGADSLKQWGVYVVANDTGDGGIWQAGSGLAADPAGNVFAVSGNGNGYDGPRAIPDTAYERGDSVIRLRLIETGLNEQDYFTPADWRSLDVVDADFGSSGFMLIPGTGLGVTGSKKGELYVLNTTALGYLQPNDTGAVQIIPPTAHPLTARDNHVHGTPVAWAGPDGLRIYVWPENDYGKAYAFNGSAFDPVPVQQTAFPGVLDSMPGGILSLSANGAQRGSGVLWANLVWEGDASQKVQPGVLRAFDASNLGTELWNSRSTNFERDSYGSYAKFAAPTVSGGKVYAGNFCMDAAVAADVPPCRVTVYGLLQA